MASERLAFNYPTSKTLQVKLSSDWQNARNLPSPEEITSQFSQHTEITQVNFDASELVKWNSTLVSFLLQLIKDCGQRNITVDRNGLPEGIQKLLLLALKTSAQVALPEEARETFLERVADKAIHIFRSVRLLVNFLGQVAFALGRLLRGKSYFRWDDFIAIVQKCGVNAFSLVSLISILVGMIFAFVGAMQLKMFGAQIFVADIVGIAVVRVIGAVMTAVIMSGRTGASFAAELGIMQVNEEVDALKTLGIDPVEFLVLPRLGALVIMLPLLTIYADLMGILGGFIISVGMLSINPVEYLNHTQVAVKLSYFWIGLTHSFVFGIIIAIAGCYRGMQCERSASGVGEATTSAVVSAITSIVIATAIITFICQVLGV